MADYINSHTAPDARVYYWGVDAQFYYLADRRCTLDIVWPYYVDITHSRERIFDSQTEYIIVANPQNMPRPDWLVDGLRKDFHLETVIQGTEIFRRGP